MQKTMPFRRPSRAQLWHALALGVVWLLVTAGASLAIFLGSSRTVVLASHETTVRPTLGGQIELHTGPLLPDLRVPSGSVLGADLTLGKTQSRTLDELVNRYAFIATQPESQLARVRAAAVDMAMDALLLGSLCGAAPVAVWLLLGAARRQELFAAARRPVGLVGVAALVVAVVVGTVPWLTGRSAGQPEREWSSLQDYVGDGITLPGELSDVQVRTDLTSAESQRLLTSAISTYRASKTWYADATAAAAELELRTPEPGETVAILVSDRHDNIGMDPVARAIGDAAGATWVLDAGDDTSAGEQWEAFSLDSLDSAFDGYEKVAVTGNHDHGTFVGDHLGDLGWTRPDASTVDGPGDSVLWGIDDPRSSGLGNWRDEPGLSFADTVTLVADEVCAQEERVNTVLVHDAALGSEALRRGCADLVVGGHLHVQVGPVNEVGANGLDGWRYTTGTTGGAAYALAVGSKLRRQAEVSLITYQEGRPVGIQPVVLRTDGRFEVRDYVPLTYAEPPADPEPAPVDGTSPSDTPSGDAVLPTPTTGASATSQP